MRLAFGMRLGFDKAWDRQDSAFRRRLSDQERACAGDQAYSIAADKPLAARQRH
jgi:hypothetical protein